MSNSPPASNIASTPTSNDETASTVTHNAKAAPNFPTKTDKPRPHVCTTCSRGFARLEHLKRHERSHTKEKPFECPECSRSFARRDLLLRHQQKLHQTSAPSSRPRRRESTSSVAPAGARARKNSIAGASAATTATAAMRPRAYTISHVDGQATQQLIATSMANPAAAARMPAPNTHSRHPSLAGLPMHSSIDLNAYAGMSTVMGQRGMHTGLKLETNSMHGLDFAGNLRTAPLFSPDFDFDFFGPPTSATINPSALQYTESPGGLDVGSPFPHGLHELQPTTSHFEDSFDWLNGNFDQHMSFNSNNENAVDGSSPSAISTTSQSGVSDPMVDGSNHPTVTTAASNSVWQPSVMGPPQMNFLSSVNVDPGFPDLLNSAAVSPQPSSQKPLGDSFFSTPPPSLSSTSMSPSLMSGLNTQNMSQAMNFPAGPETPTSMNGNNSASPVSTLTDTTRNALLSALSQCSSFGGRKFSFPALHSSPLPPRFQASTNAPDPVKNLPSTQDLQRYVGAYIQYFHPHLPFMHIPTLSFDLPAHPTSRRSLSVGGSGSLILSMAAIGALYEMEHASSRELFEMAKLMIKMYLEERRKEDVKRADFRLTPVSDHTSYAPDNTDPTPVWLVQAMLLNVIYGHNSADKAIGESSYNHCHALVSLAKAAELLTPMRIDAADSRDIQMAGDLDASWAGSARPESEEHAEWLRWKTIEEKKRTLYVIYILQSLLISAYNHQPVLTNSEITLDLPCEEEFFTAESSTVFNSKGGVLGANQNRLSFGDALRNLLSSNEKQRRPAFNATFGTMDTVNGHSTGDMKPSMFGCLVLIHALHNTLWETRQRHYNKFWTNEETEDLHSRMESALEAWKSVWEKHPHHSTTRPSRFGPLSADAMPLLDLAYVRLYVNLGRSKELFWTRDWDGMANEIARGAEMIQHAEHPPQPSSELTNNDLSDPTFLLESPLGRSSSSPKFSADITHGAPQAQTDNRLMSRRERQLRKAAFHAARSLVQSEKLNITFADFNSRELPLKAALCAFDCAQVLAEWVATLQDRVGKYIGVLGQADVDITQMPAVMLLEEEDCKLLNDIQEILQGARQKLTRQDVNNHGIQGMDHRLAKHGGYGSQILRITSCMLDRAAVWPITHLMAQCLDSHGEYMRVRAERSIMTSG